MTAVRHVLPGMRALGRGTVLFVNGGSAARPHPKVAGTSIAFAAEGAYATMLHTALAEENVHVGQLIIPGAITPGHPTHDPDILADRSGRCTPAETPSASSPNPWTCERRTLLMLTVNAYAATSPTDPLVPTTITRRDVGPNDVLIEIAYAGVCPLRHPHRPRRLGPDHLPAGRRPRSRRHRHRDRRRRDQARHR